MWLATTHPSGARFKRGALRSTRPFRTGLRLSRGPPAVFFFGIWSLSGLPHFLRMLRGFWICVLSGRASQKGRKFWVNTKRCRKRQKQFVCRWDIFSPFYVLAPEMEQGGEKNLFLYIIGLLCTMLPPHDGIARSLPGSWIVPGL